MIEKKTKKIFFIALALTIGFVLGIPAIIFGAIYMDKNGWFLALMILGISLAVLGFYVMPIFWIKFSEYKKYCIFCEKITRQNLNSVTMLSESLVMEKSEALKYLTFCMQKGFLPEYILIKQEYIAKINGITQYDKNEANIIENQKGFVICANCGAKIDIGDKATIVCPYCKTTNYIKK